MEAEVQIRENRRRRLKEVRLELFWDMLQKPVGCWLYDGAKEINGYGYLKNPLPNGPQYITAHRLAWILKHGPIPDGMRVLHKCDVRACCNPDHLFLGTDKDNAADMNAKGRNGCRGELNIHGKLTEAQAKEIIGLKGVISGNRLCRKYGVRPGAIHAIWRGETWKHLPRP